VHGGGVSTEQQDQLLRVAYDAVPQEETGMANGNDMENWKWEEVEAFIRRYRALKAAYRALVAFATLLSVLGTLFGWLAIPAQAYALLAGTVIGMAAITYVVAGIAGMRAKKYRRLLETFRELVAIQRLNYTNESVAHRIEIRPNGDAECSRRAQLASQGAPIWFEQKAG